MLYVVGIINVIVYQIIALTNLKTMGYGLFARTVAGNVGRDVHCLSRLKTLLITMLLSRSKRSVAGLHFNDSIPRL